MSVTLFSFAPPNTRERGTSYFKGEIQVVAFSTKRTVCSRAKQWGM